MEDFFKQQRRMNALYDVIGFVCFALAVFVIISKIILIAVK